MRERRQRLKSCDRCYILRKTKFFSPQMSELSYWEHGKSDVWFNVMHLGKQAIVILVLQI